MFNWRITKYNPNYRDKLGRYQKCDWTSFSEIGTTFNGIELTADDYIVIENAYVDAIVAFMNNIKITTLMVKGLEKRSNHISISRESRLYSDEMTNLYDSLQENAVLSIREIQCLARLVLRENLWCKLEIDNIMFVHFGYDYYMYVGSHKICKDAINHIGERRLFIGESGDGSLTLENISDRMILKPKKERYACQGKVGS
jgi:hypothetical protein